MSPKRHRSEAASSGSEQEAQQWGELPRTIHLKQHREDYQPLKWSRLLAATKRWWPECADTDMGSYYTDEMAYYIRRIERALRAKHPRYRGLDNYDVSVMMHLPESELQELADRAERTAAGDDMLAVTDQLKNARRLCNWFFLQGGADSTGDATRDSGPLSATSASASAGPSAPASVATSASPPDSRSASLTPARPQATPGTQTGGPDVAAGSTRSSARNQRRRADCLNRDGSKCVVIDDEDPDVCHVVPFGWSKNGKNLGKSVRYLDAISPFMAKEDFDSLFAHLTKHQRCTDQRWNMISLSQKLHRRWGKAHWAFKVLGSSDPDDEGNTDVTIQFYWMRRPAGSTPDEPENLYPDQLSEWATGGPAPILGHSAHNFHRDRIHRLIMTGDTFKVNMPKDEAPRFIQMMDLQWLIIRIAAMAGAAGHAEYLFGDGDDGGSDAAPARVGPVSEDAGPVDAPLLSQGHVGGKTARFGRRVASGAKAIGHAMRTASGRIILSASGAMDLPTRTKPPVSAGTQAQKTPMRRPVPQLPGFFKVSKQRGPGSGGSVKTLAPQASLIQDDEARTDQDQGTRADANGSSH